MQLSTFPVSLPITTFLAYSEWILTAQSNGNVVVVVVYSILSRLLYVAFSANLGLLFMPHPGMLTSLPKDGGVSCFGCSSGRSPIQFLTVHSHA